MQNSLLQYINQFRGQVSLGICSVELENQVSGCYENRHISVKILRPDSLKVWTLNQPINDCFILTNKELFTIAHEFGHFLSGQQGFHTAESNKYLMQFYRGLNCPKATKSVIDEEERAWQYAEYVLKSIGCKDFTEFNELKETSLNTYKNYNQAA